MKKCNTCLQAKDLSEFYKQNNSPDGKSYKCSACAREYSTRFFHSDPERSRERNKRNHKKFREKRLVAMKKYREEHPEKMAALYRAANVKKYWSDPEAAKQAKKEWKRNNPEKAKSLARVNRSMYRSRKVSAVGRHTRQEREAMCESYLHLCVYCKERTMANHMDHIVPLTNGGCDHIDNLVPACGSCNPSKGNLSLLQFMFNRAVRLGVL